MKSLSALALLPALLLSIAAPACSSADESVGDGTSAQTSESRFPAFAAEIAEGMPQLRLGNTTPDTEKNVSLVLTHPKIVTVTFPACTDAEPKNCEEASRVATIESFTDGLANTKGGRAFWETATSEYGVGPVISGGDFAKSKDGTHVHLLPTDLPQETCGGTGPDRCGVLDDSQRGEPSLVKFVRDRATGGNADKSLTQFPQADDTTLYAIYIPTTVKLVSRKSTEVGELDRIEGCASFQGFHTEKVRRGHDGPHHFLYTLIDEACGEGPMKGTIENTTDTAAHELAEGATDPYASIDETTALNGFDADHLSWTVFNERQEEIGDACEFYIDANIKLGGSSGRAPVPAPDQPVNAKFPSPDFPFMVQAEWSNKSARAGHNPCVPAEINPYYNVIPLQTETIGVVLPPKLKVETTTKGYQVRGNKRSFTVGLYSDADTNGEWNITAYVGGAATNVVVAPPAQPEPSKEERLAVSFGGRNAARDGLSAHGKNGDRVQVNLTVDRNAQSEHGASRTGILVTLVSEKEGMPRHYMPILVSIK